MDAGTPTISRCSVVACCANTDDADRRLHRHRDAPGADLAPAISRAELIRGCVAEIRIAPTGDVALTGVDRVKQRR